MEVYVDDMIAKSWTEEYREFEESVWQIAEIQSSSSSAKAYKAGRRFGASSGKLLGFIVSRREIEVDLHQSNYRHASTKDRERNQGFFGQAKIPFFLSIPSVKGWLMEGNWLWWKHFVPPLPHRYPLALSSRKLLQQENPKPKPNKRLLQEQELASRLASELNQVLSRLWLAFENHPLTLKKECHPIRNLLLLSRSAAQKTNSFYFLFVELLTHAW